MTPKAAAPVAPGPVSPIVPIIAAQPAQQTKQSTPPNQCPPGGKTVIWPFPTWAASGFGDVGALSPVNNRPNRFVIDRVRPPKRNRALIRQYLAMPQNAHLLAQLRTGTLRGAVHHKWPLFVGGPDAVPNFVFLTNAMHTAWHGALHIQGKYGWMTFDPVGTKYCVY